MIKRYNVAIILDSKAIAQVKAEAPDLADYLRSCHMLAKMIKYNELSYCYLTTYDNIANKVISFIMRNVASKQFKIVQDEHSYGDYDDHEFVVKQITTLAVE